MKRFIFAIFDNVAESFAEPFFIMAEDPDKATKIAMRGIAFQDMSASVIPLDDLDLFYLGFIDKDGSVMMCDNHGEPMMIANVKELKGKTNENSETL